MQSTIYNVQYNIPRVNVQAPGRQNRLADGIIRVTPGVDEPITFYFGNQDGVPIQLVPFKIKFIIWEPNILDTRNMTMGQSEVLLSKYLQVEEPYSGRVEMLLTSEETTRIGLCAGSSIRWSLFMINEEEQVFPMEVTRSHGRYGTIRVDLESGIPPSELIKNA